MVIWLDRNVNRMFPQQTSRGGDALTMVDGDADSTVEGQVDDDDDSDEGELSKDSNFVRRWSHHVQQRMWFHCNIVESRTQI